MEDPKEPIIEPNPETGEEPGDSPGGEPGASSGGEPGASPGGEPGASPGGEPGASPGGETATLAGNRPDINIKAELQRKTREIAELRAKVEGVVRGYNPNDLTTWSDQQLHALRAAPDVKSEFRLQAEDILMDRKVDRRLKNAEETRDRESFETKRIEEFPETLDPSSPLSLRMTKMVRELHLGASPAGLYAAARLAAAEMKKSMKSAHTSKREEEARITAIKNGKMSPDMGGAPRGKTTYEETLKKAATSDEAWRAALKAKVGGNGLKIPSSGL